jgi:putative transposase
MLEWVKDIAKFSDNTYGEQSIQKVLNALSFPVSRRKTAQLMEEAGVWVWYKKKYKATTNSDHKKPIYDNVLKQDFEAKKSDQAYVQGITYVWTSEGWLYLAVVIDLYSRKVVGWSMSSKIKASKVYRRPINTHDFVGSMSKKVCCWDNAVAESFFGSLKQDRVHWRNYSTRFRAQQDVLNYMTMKYISHRLHSYLDYQILMTLNNKTINYKN